MGDIVREMLNQVGDDVIVPNYKIKEARDKYDHLRAELEKALKRGESAHIMLLDSNERELALERELEEALDIIRKLRACYGNASVIHIAMTNMLERIDKALAVNEKE